MFRRLLIANRGEVAARIARTARRMGIEVVAVASTADQDQAWLQQVDRVVVIGEARASSSYLDQDALLEVARHTACSAVHPGWGFLAENAVFAARCASIGLSFVGPSPEQMRLMGDKALARSTMRALGLAPIPGSKEVVEDLPTARTVAAEVGYPILLKAVAGGGGKGMRAVEHEDGLAEGFAQARAEALASFGDGRLYIERRILGGRHVEVQVIADGYGNSAALGERECSLQRRHQKVLEEAPSPGLPAEERARILPLVADVVRRAGYVNAGTVEMLLDRDGRAWFMEMNTRLQVEHPVTEAITGLDLVELQLRVAAGERLPLRAEDVQVRGHALECRINAEDPSQGFRPSPGLLKRLVLPEGEGVRVDTHLTTGDRIPPYYDSMVAKVIVHGADREQAIARMKKALSEMVVEGVTTNLGLHQRILDWEPFRTGRYDTTSLETDLMGA
jgi:acetyl-CoA carboxylase biotin carboxylase subunit